MNNTNQPTIQKIFKFLCKFFDDILLIFCLFLILIGGYTSYDNFQLFYHAQDKSLLKYKPRILEDGTIETNNGSFVTDDFIGWITIDDTPIDYPIMQGKSNTDYLNTDPYGKYSLSGSIFLDSRNASDFSDYFSLIYGHHMENNFMFGALDNYWDNNYFMNHRKASLIIVKDGKTGKLCDLNIFAVLDTDANTEFFSPGESEITLNDIQKDALYYIPPENSLNNVIALSTCQSSETIGRLIVVGELINTGQITSLEKDDTETTKTEDENLDIVPLNNLENQYNKKDNCHFHYILILLGIIPMITCLLIKDKKIRSILVAILEIINLILLILFGNCNYDLIIYIVMVILGILFLVIMNIKEKERNL